MTRFAVHLGWHRLLETDASGLGAIRQLCQSLELRTRWDPHQGVLHLESPAEGRKVALTADAAAAAVAAGVQQALTSAGARVAVPPAAAELWLRLGAGRPGQVLVAYALTPGARRLARVLLGALVAATGKPGALRLCLRGLPARCPAVRVELPDPQRLHLPLATAVAEGLLRFWAPADLVHLLDRLAHRPALAAPPAPEPGPEPETAAGRDPGALAPSPAAVVPPGPPRPDPPRRRPGTDPFRPPGNGRVYPFPSARTSGTLPAPALAEPPEPPAPAPSDPAPAPSAGGLWLRPRGPRGRRHWQQG